MWAIFFVFMLFPLISWAACPTGECFVSPTGANGSACTAGDPCDGDKAWSLAVAGDTVTFTDGTYTGAAYMIDPPETMDGTSGNPITIRAQNDGRVWIYGEGVREPISLVRNDWIDVEGFDASGRCYANEIDNTRWLNGCTGTRAVNSDNVNFRRIVAWDGSISFTNDGGAGNFWSENTDCEDCAAFGLARYSINASQNREGPNRFNRIFSVWEGWTKSGPKASLMVGYNNKNATFENGVIMWTQARMTWPHEWVCSSCQAEQGCCTISQSPFINNIFGLGCPCGQLDNMSNNLSNSSMNGIIMFMPLSAAEINGGSYDTNGFFANDIEEFTIRNLTVYVHPDHADRNVLSLGASDSPPATNNTATNLTAIGGNASPLSCHSDWTCTNTETGSSLSDISNGYDDATGAEHCYEYANGTLQQDVPLWPWRMTPRILRAQAREGNALHYVDEEVKAIFGPPPTHCYRGIGNLSVGG